MKKITLLLMAIFTIASSYALTYTVTVPEETIECYIAGNFGEEMNWNPASGQMTRVGDTNVFTIDIPTATTASEYKYCSGPGWSYEELTATGGHVVNRSYSENDIVAKWADLYEPDDVLDASLTYTVTVPDETYECYIRGGFPGGRDWTSIKLEKIETNVYQVTIDGLKEGKTDYPYKYLCGVGEGNNDWTYGEVREGNRTWAEMDEVTAWEAIYNPGGEPEPEPEPEPEEGITYTVKVPTGTFVCYITGDFGTGNSWNTTANPMTYIGNNVFQITIASATLSSEYKYLAGTDWKYKEVTSSDGEVTNRSYNSFDTVAKWASVEPGDDLVEPPFEQITYTVTVPEGTHKCYIVGNFENQWAIDNPASEMTPTGNPNEFTITLSALKSSPYKYFSGPGWAYGEAWADGTAKEDRQYWSETDLVEAWEETYDPTSMDNFNEDSAIAFGGKGVINIKATQASTVKIISLAGNLILTQSIYGEKIISANPGYYIVTIEGIPYKVIVN